MEVGEVPKGIRWSAKAGGPPKVRIGGVSGRGRGPTYGFEGEEPFLVISLHLLEIYPCTSKKKGTLVGKFKKSRYGTFVRKLS